MTYWIAVGRYTHVVEGFHEWRSNVAINVRIGRLFVQHERYELYRQVSRQPEEDHCFHGIDKIRS